MARLTGSGTRAGYKVATTFGVPVAVGANDGFAFDSLSHSTNPTELEYAGKGRGLSMLTDSRQGALAPGGSIEAQPTFDDALIAMIATLMGQSDAPVEQTAAEGDYLHQIFFKETPLEFGTLAFETSTTTTMEYISTYFTQMRLSASDIPNYLGLGLDWVSGDRDIASVTNDNAQLATVTISDDEEIVVERQSQFLLNGIDDAALADPTDCKNILSYELTLTRNKNAINEIKCTDELGEPQPEGLFEGELTVVLSGLDDHTYFTASEAGDEYKCQLTIEGTQINAGLNKSLSVYIPKMKLVQDPEYNVTEDGENQHTLVFKVLAASAAPAGMSSALPYLEVINEKSTAYIA